MCICSRFFIFQAPMQLLFISLLALASLFGISPTSAPIPAAKTTTGETGKDQHPDLLRLFNMMQGSFSSKAQAQKDTAYFDIRLRMAPIWPGRKEALWLYVEQAMATKLDKPYRQRVYKLSRWPDGSLVSEVFSLANPLKWAGEWAKAKPLAALTPDSLLPRTGCEILLQPKGDTFVGSTGPKTCPSDLRGASYASSEVVISNQGMVSWDRGFDGSDKQVWGATKGGYSFVKE